MRHRYKHKLIKNKSQTILKLRQSPSYKSQHLNAFQLGKLNPNEDTH